MCERDQHCRLFVKNAKEFFFPVFSPSLLCNRTLNDSLTFTLTCLNMLSYPSLYSSQLKALLSETQVQLISAKAEAQEQRAELSLVSLTFGLSYVAHAAFYFE